MGFALQGFLTTEPAPLTLYENVLPARAWAVRAEGAGLPPAWLLPTPDGLEPENLAADWFAPDHGPEWADLAGVPDGRPSLWPFEREDLQLASLLSLATSAGVVLISDMTFGGFIEHEFAAVFVAGRLRAAAGFGADDADDSWTRGFILAGPAWREVDPAHSRRSPAVPPSSTTRSPAPSSSTAISLAHSTPRTCATGPPTAASR